MTLLNLAAIRRKQIRGNEPNLSKILDGRLDLLAALDVARPPEPVIVVEVVRQVLQENVKEDENDRTKMIFQFVQFNKSSFAPRRYLSSLMGTK